MSRKQETEVETPPAGTKSAKFREFHVATYRYIIELGAPAMYPRYIADIMTMLNYFAHNLVSVTDCQRSDHAYGATYYTGWMEEQEERARKPIEPYLQFASGYIASVHEEKERDSIGYPKAGY